MASLYDIDKRLMEYQDEYDPETGEWLNEDELENIKMERTDKIEQLLLWVKNLRAEAKAIKDEAKNLLDRAKALDRKADNIEGHVARHLNGEKFSTPRVLVRWRKSESVEIPNEELVPEQFMDVQTVKKPKKPEIKKWIKEQIDNGKEVAWGRIVTKNNMNIK